MAAATELAREIESTVAETVLAFASSPEVRSAWLEPIVGFADAADPLFETLPDVTIPGHARPADLLAGARSAVAFFLPFDRKIGRGNARGEHASEGWAVAYVETNRLVSSVNERIATLLARRGWETASTPATHVFDPVSLTSGWSHKHVAFVAGVGRFGVNHLLITDRGCCGRLGSLVTDAPLPPTPRPGRERCLHRWDGSCLRCIERCPVGALEEDGLARQDCYARLLENARIHEKHGLADVCGKCSTALPCSFEDPVAKKRRRIEHEDARCRTREAADREDIE